VFGVIGSGGVLLSSIFQNGDWPLIIASMTLSCMALLLLSWTVYYTYSTSRKEKYANISEKYNSISVKLRDIHVHLAEMFHTSQNRIVLEKSLILATAHLASAMDQIAALYSMITGTRCRSAIKVVQRDGENIWVHALVRDEISASENLISDKERNEKRFDRIEANADFNLLFDPTKRDQGFYLNNDLTQGDIKNSSKSYYLAKASAENDYDSVKRVGWPLPYRSTIVWPIRVMPNQSFGFSEVDCLGFLAIDSESRNVFDERWDAQIGGSVANYLYSVLTIYSIIENKVKRLADEEIQNDGGNDDA
jgi:hypothetical protein